MSDIYPLFIRNYQTDALISYGNPNMNKIMNIHNWTMEVCKSTMIIGLSYPMVDFQESMIFDIHFTSDDYELWCDLWNPTN